MFDNTIFLESGDRQTVSNAVNRYSARYKGLIEPINFVGKTVLDIGSHNGIWSAAALYAGAKKVTGVELRKDLVDISIQNVSNDDFIIIHDDMFSAIKKLKGQRYDIVFCAGTLLHTLYHLDLIKDISNLDFDLLVLDSAFWPSKEPMIYIVATTSTWCGNALANVNQKINYLNPQQNRNKFHNTLIGIPSLKYIDIILEGFGLTYTQIDYSLVDLTDAEKLKALDYLIKQNRTLHIKKSQNFNNVLTPIGQTLIKFDKEFGWESDKVKNIIIDELRGR